jgi:hypothetical protein
MSGRSEGPDVMTEAVLRPSYYATGEAGWRAWWTLLHPPYTLWHLSYVVIGAALAPVVRVDRLVATLIAFFLAMGISAHALDELHSRPLRTRISAVSLVAAAVAGLAAAGTLGVIMLVRVDAGPAFTISAVLAIVVGVVLVAAYSLEWFGGVVHHDAGFAAAWGAFPVVVAYCAQAERLELPAIVAGMAAFATAYAQRRLSTPARFIRRQTRMVVLTATLADGGVRRLGNRDLLAPLEIALRALVWGHVALAVALLTAALRA